MAALGRQVDLDCRVDLHVWSVEVLTAAWLQLGVRAPMSSFLDRNKRFSHMDEGYVFHRFACRVVSGIMCA